MSDPAPGQSPLEGDELERVAIWGDLDPTPVALQEERSRLLAPIEPGEARRRPWSLPAKIVLALVGLWVFLIALALMKDGARGLAPALNAAIETPFNALGLGWLGALLVLSGSPVAASALALFDGGSLTIEQGYAMVVGSRLGAAFVVLVIGTLYALRRTESGRRAPISIGVLALAMTFIAYVPGGLLGFLLLRSGIPSSLALTPPAFVFDGTRALTAPVSALVEAILSPDQPLSAGLLFVLGVALLLASFRVVDLFLPEIGADRDDERARWYAGPWTMFGIGLLVALATLSVSVALSVLVPVVAKGYVRREQILPYIAGANITTLFDTLVVAVLLGNPLAPAIVVSVAGGVAAWTVLLLALTYQPLRRLVFDFQGAVLHSRRRLLIFVGLLFLVPISLLIAR